MTYSLELNIALIPEASLAKKHIMLSQRLAKEYPALVQLGGNGEKLSLTPHLTLYQVPLEVSKLSQLETVLATLAQQFHLQQLVCTGFAYNKDEASFEAQYEVTAWLVGFQDQLIAAVNPLRGDLLIERDPAGHLLSDLLEKQDSVGKNIRTTGYGEVGDPRKGGLFRPHVTLNWFALGTDVDPQQRLPSLDTLRGTFSSLGVYVLGPFGTCPQRLAEYHLSV